MFEEPGTTTSIIYSMESDVNDDIVDKSAPHDITKHENEVNTGNRKGESEIIAIQSSRAQSLPHSIISANNYSSINKVSNALTESNVLYLQQYAHIAFNNNEKNEQDDNLNDLYKDDYREVDFEQERNFVLKSVQSSDSTVENLSQLEFDNSLIDTYKSYFIVSNVSNGFIYNVPKSDNVWFSTLSEEKYKTQSERDEFNKLIETTVFPPRYFIRKQHVTNLGATKAGKIRGDGTVVREFNENAGYMATTSSHSQNNLSGDFASNQTLKQSTLLNEKNLKSANELNKPLSAKSLARETLSKYKQSSPKPLLRSSKKRKTNDIGFENSF